MNALVERILAANECRAPFPFPQVGGLTVSPIYAIHHHDLMDLVNEIVRLQAALKARGETT